MRRITQNVIDTWESQVKNEIDTWGRNIRVVYGATANCSSCGYDPINKEATNVSCDTCNGTFFFDTEVYEHTKGVMKTFIGTMKFRDYTLAKHGHVPDHDARLTCWLEDILYNECSATGDNYFDRQKIIRVEVDGKDYTIASTYKTGIDHLKVMIATLKEVKREA